MIAIFIAFVVALLSFNCFMISFQINGVNRLVLGAPTALFETAIDMLNIDMVYGPTFDQNTLESNLTSYFAYSMPNFTDDYSLSFYYYNPENHAVCLFKKCQAVEVTVSANLVLNYHYQRTMFYEIRSN